jgi:hypothetical protein
MWLVFVPFVVKLYVLCGYDFREGDISLEAN